MRKQQGGGSAGRGSGIASNLQRQQPPAIGTQQTYAPSQPMGYVPSQGMEGRRQVHQQMSAQQYATSPKSGRGIW